MKKISILGATGSIGTQTLDVLRKDRENFQLIGVSANSNFERLLKIVKEFRPSYAVLTEREAYLKFREYFKNENVSLKILFGKEGLNTIASLPQVDMVVTSIVGMSGLIPTIKGIESGKDIALANKETLVVGGKLVTELAKKNNVNLIPVDSEHSAIFQCLQGNKHSDVGKLIITPSKLVHGEKNNCRLCYSYEQGSRSYRSTLAF